MASVEKNRRTFSSGSEFEQIAGYSRVVVDGDLIFVAGTTGFDYGRRSISASVSEQTSQALRNVEAFLSLAGATLNDVVQCNWVITKREYFEICGPILKGAFGPSGPAMMTLVCDLVDERMKFEMQVIARRDQRVASPPR